jgi:Tol biopolymer transport system component
LAANFEDARLPIWSSDGRFILFSGCRSSEQPLRTCVDWWVTNADGVHFTKTGAMPLLRRQEIIPADTVGVWRGDTLFFSGRRQNTDSLWELSISEPEFRAVGRPRQLTSGDAGGTAVSIAENGSIAIGRMSGALHVWRIDHAATTLTASPSKVTGEGASDISPNVSHNGRWLVFGRRYGKYRDIWLKDLWSGRETALVLSKFNKASPLIDDSGTNIVYEQQEPEASTIWIARGQYQRKLCAACSNPTAWFGDGAFFYSESSPTKIMVMDIRTEEPHVALDAPFAVSNADWSPANRYLLFTASPDGSRKQVFATSFPLPGAEQGRDWIPITRESEWADRPRWSGDGKTIFYLSNRDGFRCLWGQRFDPALGKVTGPPFAVTHYHNPRISPDRVRQRSFNISVSGNSIFLNLGEEAESIWIGNLRLGRYIPRFF